VVPRVVGKPLNYILVLDFEATCEKDQNDYVHEIIEVPVVMLNVQTGKIEAEFHSYVRPTTNPILTNFCKELTGIEQEWVNHSKILSEVMTDLHDWLIKVNLLSQDNLPIQPFAFATDGPWDFDNFLVTEYSRLSLPVPFYFHEYVNIRMMFADYFRCSRMNVSRMLERMGMQFQGRLHSGIDDSRNITQIAKSLISSGCPMEVNAKLKILEKESS